MYRKLLNIALTLIFMLIFVVYFYYNKSDFEVLTQINIWHIMLIALIQLMIIILNAFFLITILKGLELKIGRKEGIYISFITSIGNYFTPFRGGAGIRAIYLKNKYKFPYSKFLSSLAGNYIVVFLVNSVVTLIGIAILLQQDSFVDKKIIMLFVSLFLFLISIIALPIPTKPLRSINLPIIRNFTRNIALVIEGWNLLSKNHKIVIRLVLLTLISLPITLFLYFVEFKAIGLEINILHILLYSAISNITFLISLTPGSLGIKESVLVLFKDTLTLSTSSIIAISVVDRGIYFFVMIFLFIVNKYFKDKTYDEHYKESQEI